VKEMFNFLKKAKEESIENFIIDYMATKKQLTDLSIEIAITRIANTIAKCGFQVVTTNDDERKAIEYILNLRPNKNQTSADFWKQAINRAIIRKEGCLIVKMNNDDIFIADSWNEDDSVLKGKVYSNVTIVVGDDELTLNKRFKADDVVLIKDTNHRLLRLLKKVDEEMDVAWNVAVNGFRSKAPKIKVKIPGQGKLIDENGETLTRNKYTESITNNMKEKDIKAFFVSSGIDIETLDTKNQLTSQDIENLRKEVFKTTAMCFGIPQSILFGESDKTGDDSRFMTYACGHIIKTIEDALNFAWVTKEEYLKGKRINVNKLCVKHIDVIDNADKLDKLYSNGWSHNDILKLLNQPPVDEEWADKRRFTKNYSGDIEGGEE
jgi:HK97 family phage portal protein